MTGKIYGHVIHMSQAQHDTKLSMHQYDNQTLK